MIKLIGVAAFALAVATSAQAMSPPPLHQSDGLKTEAYYRHYGYYGHGVARRHVRRHVRRCALWHAGVCARWHYVYVY